MFPVNEIFFARDQSHTIVPASEKLISKRVI